VEARGTRRSADEMADGTGRYRTLRPRISAVARVFAGGFAAYHLFVLGVSPIDPWIHRVVHLVGVAALLFVFVHARRGAPSDRPSVPDLALIGLMIGTLVYISVNFEDLIHRLGVLPEPADVAYGIVLVVLVLEMGRRLHGWVLPAIAIAFIGYALFGAHIPGMFGHKGYGIGRTATFLAGLDGIYGSAIAASATFVTLFVIFGALLNQSGAGKFFVDLAYAAAGGRRGGPAKVAILASALFGSISGSAVSNAVTTGTFTIPLMKTVGYTGVFAAAVEAVASTGGQVMPPVMSATAFVMSEITGIPYLEIAWAALVPSVLYFLAVYFMVDYEAKNLGLLGVPRSELPTVRSVLLRDGHLLVPLAVLVYALVVLQVSPLKSALFAMVATVAVSWLRAATRMGPIRVAKALSDGMIGMIDIAVSCALAGIIVGVFSLTGLGLKFAGGLIALSGSELWLALFLTMVVCIVLGMGMPTLAAYVIAAAAVAPALEQLGVPALAAHLFILYFAAISTITPPVAITAFAAAGLAGVPPIRVGFLAVKLGITAYIVPFMFVYSGALLLRGDWREVLVAIPTAMLGVWALSRGVQDRSVHGVWRIIYVLAAVVLIKPGIYTDMLGIGLIAVAFLGQRHLALARQPS
jgi:TRAP transporter 4TM/12TM fusion protein